MSVQCGSCVAFGGAANRNRFSTNTLRSSSVAYDFGIAGNASETNVFINENVEGWGIHILEARMQAARASLEATSVPA